MLQVIVSVRQDQEPEEQARDLEVPAEIASGKLAALIAESLGWKSGNIENTPSYEITAEPLGRDLATDESLADAGVWDGARLILRPAGSQYSSSKKKEPPQKFPQAQNTRPHIPPMHSDIEVIWTSLDASPSHKTEDTETTNTGSAPQSGFAWKRLDE